MAESIETHAPDHHGDEHHEEGGIRKYLFSTDHKIIAMQYLFTGLAMGLIGGFFPARRAARQPVVQAARQV